ncbi:serine hydrolase domain-containing protein [Erythrobacter sp. W302b]|uniref:serine hydrolase domain-containing protein n=1 Tax=Erythrobacter sp. W302b TaxID=3389874 RepID=UPI00396B46AC
MRLLWPGRPAQRFLIAKQGGSLFEPGTDRSYSKAGYVLLGRIIEKVSGESYVDYAEQHIFAPSNMVASEYDTQEDVTPKLATGYFREGAFAATWKANWLTLPFKGSPAGGDYSTNANLRGGKWVGEETLNAMFADSVPPGRSPRRKSRLPSIARRPLLFGAKAPSPAWQCPLGRALIAID